MAAIEQYFDAQEIVDIEEMVNDVWFTKSVQTTWYNIPKCIDILTWLDTKGGMSGPQRKVILAALEQYRHATMLSRAKNILSTYFI